MTTRRGFLAGAAAGASALGLPGIVRAQAAPTPLRVAGFAIDVGAAPYYAVDMGFFKEHGIAAEINTMFNGPAIASAVLGGALDIGNADTCSISQAHARGLDLVMIGPSGAYRSSAPTSALMVAKSSSIQTPRDLVGKTFGTPALHSFGEAIVDTWFRKVGLRREDIKMVEIPFPEMPAALASGRIDAVQAEEPMVSILSKNARIIARPSDAVAAQFIEGGLFCTREFAQKNSDVVKRFADAIAETNAWANTHHDESFAILAKYAKAPPPKTMARVFYPERLHANDIQPVIDMTAAVGFIPKSFAARDIVAPGLLV